MGPVSARVMAAVAAQGVTTAGPVFAHHLKMDPGTFEFELGVPVRVALHRCGPREAGPLPRSGVARTVLQRLLRRARASMGRVQRVAQGERAQAGTDPLGMLRGGPGSGPDPANWAHRAE
jgi:hypothetical protein